MGSLSGGLVALLYWVCLGVHVWALIDCAMRRQDAFPAAGKLTKPAWLAITGIAVAIGVLLNPLGILGIVSIVASIVYLVDVRPAVKEVQSGGGGGW